MQYTCTRALCIHVTQGTLSLVNNEHAELTRAWPGYFHNTTDRGGAISPLPQISITTRSIYKIQTAFEKSGKFIEETQCRWPRGHRRRHRSGQGQNIWRLAMFGFVTHYNRIKWNKVNKWTWAVCGLSITTVLSFLWAHFRSRSSMVKRLNKVKLKTPRFGVVNPTRL